MKTCLRKRAPGINGARDALAEGAGGGKRDERGIRLGLVPVLQRLLDLDELRAFQGALLTADRIASAGIEIRIAPAGNREPGADDHAHTEGALGGPSRLLYRPDSGRGIPKTSERPIPINAGLRSH